MNTTIIMVSFKSEILIEKNIARYNSSVKILIIENSFDNNLKSRLENKYENVKVILNENNGFGQAANLGAKLAKTKYIFFCSPDNFAEKDSVKKLEDLSEELNDQFGMFVLSDENNCPEIMRQIKKTEGILCFFIKRETFLRFSGFDEKFFLYYEDNDLVKRLLKNNITIRQVPIKYSNFLGSHNKKFNHPVEVNRNWHLMWSKFYYKKKHFGYLYSFLTTLPYFIRAIFRLLFNINKPLEKEIYLARISGLYNSYILKDPWYRPKIDEK